MFDLSVNRMQPRKEVYDKQKYFDYGLEGLRGLAAFWVGYAHIFNFKNLLDPNFHPSNQYIGDFHASHGAVLIFFVLSGYVIGLTNTKPCNKSRIFNYLVRRLIRLVPIYFIAIFFSVIASPQDSLKVILGNLFFLQPGFVKVLSGNPILWTLNYEIIYYFIFILIWYYKPKSIYLFLGALLIAIWGWIIPDFPQLLSAYASGWIFWLCGLWLAWQGRLNHNFKKFSLWSYLFLIAATNHFATGKIILNGIGLANNNAEIINLSDLALLPICLLIIGCITHRINYIKLLQIISFAIPIGTIIILVATERLWSNPHWIVSTVFTSFALILLPIKVSSNLLKNLVFLGSISYAFYVLHMPILYLIHDYFPLSGSWFSFILRFIIWFCTTIGISSILELVIQPRIKNLFQKKVLLEIS